MIENYVEIAKLVLPAIALIISLFSFRFAKRNLAKQIRAGKIEESLEIIYSTFRDYKFLYMIVMDMKNVKEKQAKKEFVSAGYLDYPTRIKQFVEKTDQETLQRKMARLHVILNAYLLHRKAANLYFRITALAEIQIYLYQTVFSKPLSGRNFFAEYGLPKPARFEQFVERIINDLVTEIGLGKKYSTYQEYKKFRDTQLIKDLDLSNNDE